MCCNRDNANIACKVRRYDSDLELMFCQFCKNSVERTATNSQLMSPLKQRCFEDVAEVTETQEMVVLNANDACGIAFVFHIEDVRSSEHSCVGIEHCHTTRCRFSDLRPRVLEMIERNDHKAFSSQESSSHRQCDSDYCEDT